MHKERYVGLMLGDGFDVKVLSDYALDRAYIVVKDNQRGRDED